MVLDIYKYPNTPPPINAHTFTHHGNTTLLGRKSSQPNTGIHTISNVAV